MPTMLITFTSLSGEEYIYSLQDFERHNEHVTLYCDDAGNGAPLHTFEHTNAHSGVRRTYAVGFTGWEGAQ